MSSPQHEPTMEEILASIRKIISEDTPAEPAAQPSPPPEAAKQELLETPSEAELEAEPADIEVLELTQEIIDTPEPEPVAMSEPPKPAETPEEVVFEEVEQPAEPAAGGGIFSDQTRRAMDDAFASLSEEPEEPAPAPRAPTPPLPSVGGTSVESVFERAVRESFEPVLEKYLSDNSGAVIERMKPLIREWMDEHFPALLEGAVRTEIERVVRARGRR
jgi:cell pole-organizing protein PopZ